MRAESAELELRQRSLYGKDLLVIASLIGLLLGDKRLKDAANFPLSEDRDGFLERTGELKSEMVELQRKINAQA